MLVRGCHNQAEGGLKALVLPALQRFDQMEASKRHTAKLKRMLQAGETEAARHLFDGLLEAREANFYHVSVMLAHGNMTSAESESFIERAEAAGVAPNVDVFNVLLNQLQHEGKPLEPTLAAMQARGIEPNERTRKMLSRTLTRRRRGRHRR